VKYRSTDKAAIRHFEEGKKYYDSREDGKAVKSLQAAIARDSNFVEAWLILGQISIESRDLESARFQYRKAVSVDPSYMPGAHLMMGDLEVKAGNYERAEADYTNYLTFGGQSNPAKRAEAEKKVGQCRFAITAVRNPVPFDPVNAGPGVNSSENEYFPSLTVDQSEIIFTRDIRDDRAQGGHQEDFFIARRKDTVWATARNAGAPLNTALNEGGPSISADGRVLFYTACDRPDGRGSCDIYLAQRMADGNWGKPINLGSPINTSAWESQPSFSSDGKTLYFIRGSYNRERRRMMDIYVSTFRDDMTWSEPVKLPEVVNTPGQEESVFIHPDNQTLYFASDGHPGMGGKDIFLSRRQSDGSWGEPVNIGYPVNTQADENSLVVSSDGRKAWFASDRSGGYGNLDLYFFDLHAEARPLTVSYVKARVRDAVSGDPLAAQFEIVDVESGKVVVSNTTDRKRGEFLACLPAGKNYMMNVQKEGYLFYSDHFECSKANDKQQAFELDIRLQRPVAGEKVVLKNIFFDVNRYTLKPESSVELDRLVQFLRSQSQIRIEVGGHTDSTGDKKANQLLSENRARAVVDYLVAKGISTSRLTAKGYGDTKPVSTNDTEEGRATNRRTEFTIL
jgi:outer membrane protein OmpA-like peptidoglycan-associated protein